MPPSKTLLELETLQALEAHVRAGRPLSSCAFQHLDLRAYTRELLAAPLEGSVLLGCQLEPEARRHAEQSGALLFPDIPHLPFKPYRSSLYSVPELYQGYAPHLPERYERTLDAAIYHSYDESRRSPSHLLRTLAFRLHDHAVTDALEEFLVGRRVVAVMGGHSLPRGAPSYRDVARLAAELTRHGFLVASGGGPGAMEATNLGAYLATFPAEALEEALALLAQAPHYQPREAWLDAAFRVRERFPLDEHRAPRSQSLSIPTWHYGHEPPNAFASHVAKYFENSVREEGLLAIATSGVIFSPGSAGTIQEIFQDACQNHYQSYGGPSPMIFLGRRFWTEDKPVFPLLERLAQGHAYARWLTLTDDIDDVLRALQEYARYQESKPEGTQAA
jgi:predicted Rossmann-fold nucleotide-binding protein